MNTGGTLLLFWRFPSFIRTWHFYKYSLYVIVEFSCFIKALHKYRWYVIIRTFSSCVIRPDTFMNIVCTLLLLLWHFEASSWHIYEYSEYVTIIVVAFWSFILTHLWIQLGVRNVAVFKFHPNLTHLWISVYVIIVEFSSFVLTWHTLLVCRFHSWIVLNFLWHILNR